MLHKTIDQRQIMVIAAQNDLFLSRCQLSSSQFSCQHSVTLTHQVVTCQLVYSFFLWIFKSKFKFGYQSEMTSSLEPSNHQLHILVHLYICQFSHEVLAHCNTVKTENRDFFLTINKLSAQVWKHGAALAPVGARKPL